MKVQHRRSTRPSSASTSGRSVDRDPDRIVSFVTDDYTSVHIAVRGTGLTGRDTYRARLDVFLADFPELEYEVIDLIAADDRVAVDYWMRGHYAGAGVDHAPFEIRGAFWFVLRDGLIAHRVDYRDSGDVRTTGRTGHLMTVAWVLPVRRAHLRAWL